LKACPIIPNEVVKPLKEAPPVAVQRATTAIEAIKRSRTSLQFREP